MAGLLDATEMADLRADGATALDTAIVVTRTTSSAANIGVTESSATVYSGLALVTRPSAPMLAALGTDVVGNTPAWVVTVPNGTDMQPGDLVSVGGATYRIQAALKPQSYSVFDAFLMSATK